MSSTLRILVPRSISPYSSLIKTLRSYTSPQTPSPLPLRTPTREPLLLKVYERHGADRTCTMVLHVFPDTRVADLLRVIGNDNDLAPASFQLLHQTTRKPLVTSTVPDPENVRLSDCGIESDTCVDLVRSRSEASAGRHRPRVGSWRRRRGSESNAAAQPGLKAPAKIGSRTERPRWRQHAEGLNLEGPCTNRKCAAYERAHVCSQQGFGTFDLVEDMPRCPECKEVFEAVSAGFMGCHVEIEGREVHKGRYGASAVACLRGSSGLLFVSLGLVLRLGRLPHQHLFGHN